jgi:hypothetical protein
LRLAPVLATSPVMKFSTVRCIEIDLVHLDGQVEYHTVAHFTWWLGMMFYLRVGKLYKLPYGSILVFATQ